MFVAFRQIPGGAFLWLRIVSLRLMQSEIQGRNAVRRQVLDDFQSCHHLRDVSFVDEVGGVTYQYGFGDGGDIAVIHAQNGKQQSTVYKQVFHAFLISFRS